MEQGITQAADDERQAAPMLEELKALPKHPGRIKTPIANTEYAVENNVNACKQAKSRPLIALVRQTHNPSADDRFAEPAPLHTDNPRRSKRLPPRFSVAQTTSAGITIVLRAQFRLSSAFKNVRSKKIVQFPQAHRLQPTASPMRC